MRINPENFLIGEIPVLYPGTPTHIEFWRNAKKYCIEGYWSNGVWMPGKLFYYVNFATIKLNKAGAKVKHFGRPILRDLEWTFFRLWEEARGWSGFEEAQDWTSLRLVKELEDQGITTPDEHFKKMYPNALKEDGTLKKYIPAREALKTQFRLPLGRPLYDNESQNLFMFGCHSLGTKVRMFDGKVINIEDVQEGDKLLGIDDKPRTVKKLISGPLKPMFKVKQSNGESYDVTYDHELEILDHGQRKKIKAADLYSIQERMTRDSYISRYRGFKRGKVEFNKKDVPLDPYFLGVWLGDGNSKSKIVTTSDIEIVYELSRYANSLGGKISMYSNNYSKNARSSNYKVNILGENTILESLRSLNLISNKHIPDAYLYNCEKSRLELLAGLLDTDGVLDKTYFRFYQKDKRLVEQVRDLAISLGFSTHMRYRVRKGIEEYSVSICGDITRIPTRIFRKQPQANSTKDFTISYIELEPIEPQPYFGVEVDHDNSYCLYDYTLTGNSRGFGKSYSVGGIVSHEFLFDGQTKYDPEQDVTAAEIVVGAGDSKYSTDTLSKVKTMLEMLPGAGEFGGKVFPSPLTKRYSGSWSAGRQVTASYKKKVGGQWSTVGTKSNIKNRSFADNPYAANGTRPGIMVFEEAGIFSNLEESYTSSVDCQRDEGYKFGSMLFTGTGGDMEGGTLAAKKMFYNPRGYDCIEIDDEWEYKGKIGYFVPAYMNVKECRDDWGFIEKECAKQKIQKVRDKKKEESSLVLQNEMTYNPVVPSEMFLQAKGNFFPVSEIANRLSDLEQDSSYNLLAKKVELFFSPDNKENNGVDYRIDVENSLTFIDEFPWKKEDRREGCVVIYELPQTIGGIIPPDAYIIGHDPYRSDDPSGPSLASIFVLKSKKYFKEIGHDEVVAVYRGRPFEGRKKVNEILYKLSLFYGGAKVYFENAVGNVKEYFEKIGRLDLLATQPRTILSKKASYASNSSSLVYGYPMSNRYIKLEAIQYIRDWLLEPHTTENGRIIRNLDRIWDKALLQEMMLFNLDGNFDSVMGFAGCIIGLRETYNQLEEEIQSSKQNNPLLEFLSNNKNLFPNTKPNIQYNEHDFSKAEAIVQQESGWQL